ncbi:uncharacterized protein [Triticum aestivum]|uniref:uncharacterized protein isoform X1 n=1 Tax=Triticum aestivum TaxID=4565 RepID=UPI001D01397C|nr:uncharacterized protein LOC123170175 isoform X1 [Triticum aestivum]XP_044443939.1 uncharacterized protein LOC123170175 isoform X1 [Triticum aestivum]XP_044443940.1 uncharacterized protein LOC123170175 isoform X1 [Triticum aestivum]
MFRGSNGLAPVFTLVPSILPVKILIVQAYIHGYEQNLTTPPHGTFMHLSHMTCQLIVFSGQPNAHNGILQLARCLDVAPRLVKLHLDMVYLNLDDGGSDEVMEEEEVVNAQTKFGVDRADGGIVYSYVILMMVGAVSQFAGFLESLSCKEIMMSV